MKGWAYYNEIDAYAAAWLRNLIDAGHIAPGVVDTRSIVDVRPEDLRGFSQCHFFAGIGVWSYALRRAGWPDDRRVWTGSAPCQPFSSAGKGGGFDDERHLWPAWHWLIEQCEPATVLGEQVASKDAEPWLDLVQADLEGLGYAVGAVPFPAASVGAPHIRDRLYWVAHNSSLGRQRRAHTGRPFAQGAGEWREGVRDAESRGIARVVADSSSSTGLAQRIGKRRVQREALGACAGQAVECGGDVGVVGHADEGGSGRHTGAVHSAQGEARLRQLADSAEPAGAACVVADDDDEGLSGLAGVRLQRQHVHDADRRGPVNGFWAAADWIPCRDGKFRPVEPGTFPLAHGAPARVGRLRAYGNAINAQQAQVFIEEVMGCLA